MKKTVCLLATGGTISGEGAPGQSARYVSGSLDAENLLRSMPALPEDVEVRCEQICNIQSDDITTELWFTLAGRIRALAGMAPGTVRCVMRGGGTAREGRSCVFTGRRDACRTGGWEMKRTVQNRLCAVLVLWMLNSFYYNRTLR